MACNCTTNEQLAELYKKFGYKIEVSKNASLKLKAKAFFVNASVYFTMLLITPLLITYVAYTIAFGSKRISLKKFFGLKERTIQEYYNDKRKDIQNKNKD